MSKLPTLVIKVNSAFVNGQIEFDNPAMAREMLGEFYSDQANMFRGRLKVRDAETGEIIKGIRAFNVREGWVNIASKVIANAGIRHERKITAALELEPPQGT